MSEQDPQQAPEPILTRTDPTAIIAGIGVGLQAAEMALNHFGNNAPPPAPKPEPPQVILPPGVDGK
jgi:hypothetical protein